MSSSLSLLERLLDSLIFKTKKTNHDKKRKLVLESLEVREMLSVVGFHSVQNAEENGRAGFFRLERDDNQGELTVHYQLDSRNINATAGWAADGVDFATLSGNATFGSGEYFVDINVTALTDGLVEGVEQVGISLATDPGENYFIDATSNSAILSILDADGRTVNVEAVVSVAHENDDVFDAGTPDGLSVDVPLSQQNALSVTWGAVQGATAYVLQRSTDGTAWTTIGTTTSLEYWDWNRPVGQEQYYRVASLDSNDSVSEYSTVASGRRLTPLDPPVLASPSRTETAIVLEWTPVENAASYAVYISKDGGQTWQWYTGTTATTCICYGNYTTGEEALFRVSAFDASFGYEGSTGNVFSTLTSYEIPATTPSRPSGLTAVSTDSSKITVAWNASKNATSYEVERSDSADGVWATVYQGSATTFEDTNVPPSTFYYYRVSATNSEGASEVSYVVSAQLCEAPADPMTPTGLTATTLVSGGTQLNWDAVEGAVAYMVQWCSADGNWGGYTVMETSFNSMYFTENEERFFRVASVDSRNNLSEYCSAVSGRMPVRTELPAIESVTRIGTSVLVEWNAVENAVQYNIEMSRDGGLTWNSIALYKTESICIYTSPTELEDELRFRARVWTAEDGYKYYGDYGATYVSLADTNPAELPPPRPAGVVPATLDASHIEVAWETAAEASGYRVERTNSPSGEWTTVYEGSNAFFIDSDLDAETIYYYRVASTNAQGESRFSYVVSAMTSKAKSGTAVFRFSLDETDPGDEATTVCYRLSGTATLDADYTVLNGGYDSVLNYGTIEIPAGKRVVDLKLNMLDDLLSDPSETIIVTILDRIPGGDGTLLYGSENFSASVAIADDEPVVITTPTVRIDSSQNGIEGVRDGYVRLRRDLIEAELTVLFGIQGDSSYGTDYEIDGFDRNTSAGSVTFLAGSEYVDIAIRVFDNEQVDGNKNISLFLHESTNETYVLADGDAATVVLIRDDDTEAGPGMGTDSFHVFQGETFIVSNTSSGLLANDIDPQTGLPFDPVRDSAVLVEGPSNGILALNTDGTFSYTADESYYGSDIFRYKIVREDDTETEIATVLFVVTPQTGGNSIPLDGGTEIPNAVPIALDFLESEDTSFFIPETIGTYTTTDTYTKTNAAMLQLEDETILEGVLTETWTITIESLRTENGWTYVELVDRVYTERYDGMTYTGGVAYVFSAWADGDRDGYVFASKSSDGYGTSSEAEGNFTQISEVKESEVSIKAVNDPGNDHWYWESVSMTVDTVSSSETTETASYSATGWVVTVAQAVLRIDRIDDDIYRTILSGSEEIVAVYEESGSYASTDSSDLDVAELLPESPGLLVSTYSETGSFTASGTEYYRMNFHISSDEREIETGSGTELVLLGISGDYATEMSSTTRKSDRMGIEYSLSGENESHAASFSSESQESSTTESCWTAFLADDAWVLAVGATEISGLLAARTESNVVSATWGNESENDFDDATGITTATQSSWSAESRFSETDRFETSYEYSESVVDGEWVADAGLMTTAGLTVSQSSGLVESETSYTETGSSENAQAGTSSSFTASYTASGTAKENEYSETSYEYSETIVLGEWAVASGTMTTTGTATSSSESVVEGAVHSQSTSGDRDGTVSTLLTTGVLSRTSDDSVETYEIVEAVSGGVWATVSGTISTSATSMATDQSETTGTSTAVTSDGSSVWNVTSSSEEGSGMSMVLESVWSSGEDWLTTGTCGEGSYGREESFMQLQQETYSRQIENAVVSGTYGYAEREFNGYSFSSEYEWIDDDWELTGGAGYASAISEEGTGWSAEGTILETEPSAEDPNEWTVSRFGEFSERGFSSHAGGGIEVTYSIVDGEWVEDGESIESATSSESYGYDYNIVTTGEGTASEESGGVRSSQQTYVGYDGTGLLETWGRSTVDYSEWAVHAVVTDYAVYITVEDGGEGPPDPGGNPGDGNPLFQNPGEEGEGGGSTTRVLSYRSSSTSRSSYRYDYSAVYLLMPDDVDVTQVGGALIVGGGGMMPQYELDGNTAPENLEWREIYFTATTTTILYAGSDTLDGITGSSGNRTRDDVTVWTVDGGFLGLVSGGAGGDSGGDSRQFSSSAATSSSLGGVTGDPNTLWSLPCGHGTTTNTVSWYDKEVELNEDSGSANGQTWDVYDRKEKVLTGIIVVVSEVFRDGTAVQESVNTRSETNEEVYRKTESYEYSVGTTVKTQETNEIKVYNDTNTISEYYVVYREKTENGEWIITEGRGETKGKRNWSYDSLYSTNNTSNTVYIGNGLDETNSFHFTRTTCSDLEIGNYSDSWNSVSEYDAGLGWILTSGDMTGSGTALSDISEKITTSQTLNSYRDGEQCHVWVTESEEIESITNKENISLNLTVHNGSWDVNEKTRHAESNSIYNYSVFGNTDGMAYCCHDSDFEGSTKTYYRHWIATTENFGSENETDWLIEYTHADRQLQTYNTGGTEYFITDVFYNETAEQARGTYLYTNGFDSIYYSRIYGIIDNEYRHTVTETLGPWGVYEIIEYDDVWGFDFPDILPADDSSFFIEANDTGPPTLAVPAVPAAISGVNFTPSSTIDEVCFVEGHWVELEDLTKKTIETIAVGDRVRYIHHEDAEAENDTTAKIRSGRVTRVFHNAPAETYSMTCRCEATGETKTIRGTGNHPFNVAGRGWTPLSELVSGMELVGSKGNRFVVSDIVHHAEKVPVYNIEVEGGHTYFISDTESGEGVLVHNLCEADDTTAPSVPSNSDPIKDFKRMAEEYEKNNKYLNILQGSDRISPIDSLREKIQSDLNMEVPDYMRGKGRRPSTSLDKHIPDNPYDAGWQLYRLFGGPKPQQTPRVNPGERGFGHQQMMDERRQLENPQNPERRYGGKVSGNEGTIILPSPTDFDAYRKWFEGWRNPDKNSKTPKTIRPK